MATRVQFKFVPHYHQAVAFKDDRKIVAAVAGARSGKTELGAAWAGLDAILQPGFEETTRLGDSYEILVATENYGVLNSVVRPKVLGMLPPEVCVGPYHHGERKQIVRGRCGLTNMWFLSTSRPQAWVGKDLNRVWLDEFAICKEEIFDEALARLSNRQGRLLCTGTPMGPNWAKKRLYDPWLKGEIDEIGFHTWTTADNPFFPRQELRRLKKLQSPQWFRRTYLAKWDTFEGQIYEDFLPEIHVKPHLDYRFYRPDGRQVVLEGITAPHPETIRLVDIVAGVDWGYSDDHPGVILVLGLDTKKRWWVLEESYSSRVEVYARQGMDSWVRRAQAIRGRWGVNTFFCDPARPEHLATFNREGLRAVPADNSVMPGIEYVATLIRVRYNEHTVPVTGFFVLSRCKNTIEEFTFYHWKTGRDEPEKIMDHTPDAARYGLYSYSRHGTFKREKGWYPGRKVSA